VCGLPHRRGWGCPRRSFKFLRAGEVSEFPEMPLPGGYAAEFFAGVPPFDTAASGPELRYTNENHTVTSGSGTNTMAVCARGFSRGRAVVEFRLDSDTKDNEMSAFGFTSKPLTSHSYDNGASALMLRCYNGERACGRAGGGGGVGMASQRDGRQVARNPFPPIVCRATVRAGRAWQQRPQGAPGRRASP
jgi:hypothetical protein